MAVSNVCWCVPAKQVAGNPVINTQMEINRSNRFMEFAFRLSESDDKRYSRHSPSLITVSVSVMTVFL